jgi:hypothetical protein
MMLEKGGECRRLRLGDYGFGSVGEDVQRARNDAQPQHPGPDLVEAQVESRIVRGFGGRGSDMAISLRSCVLNGAGLARISQLIPVDEGLGCLWSGHIFVVAPFPVRATPGRVRIDRRVHERCKHAQGSLMLGALQLSQVRSGFLVASADRNTERLVPGHIARNR